MKALKSFGLGLLWAILSPLLLVMVALCAIYGVFVFLIEGVIAIVNFFAGKDLFPPFPEDKKAYAIFQKAIDKANGEENKEPAQPAVQNVYVQQNYYTRPGEIPPQGAPLPSAQPNPWQQVAAPSQPDNGLNVPPPSAIQGPEAPVPQPTLIEQKNPSELQDLDEEENGHE